LKKGLLDLLICVAASIALCQLEPVRMWLPLVKGDFLLSPWVFIPVSSGVMWFAINATNCTDGVDGLAGTLALLSLLYLGGFLYGVVGHKEISQYLLVTHNPEGAQWALLVFTFIGTLTAYLWFNANPSQMLMGDAGSRMIGLLMGVAVMASGNPFLIIVVAPIILVNGGAGLIKLGLLRMAKRLGFETAADTASHPVKLLHRVRFPLHDHCRKHLNWSCAQVLMRFALLQAMLIPFLLVLLIKLR
jgi:phospho-N-acetylmuramoyl-pentapeptide-transferase